MFNKARDNMKEDQDVIEQTQNGYTEVEIGSKLSDQDSKWFFDSRLMIYDVEAGLYNGDLIVDKNGNYKVKIAPNVQPIMSKFGIDEIVSDLKFLISKHQPTSIVDEDRIKQMCLVISRALLKKLYLNMERYRIDPIKAESILTSIMNLVEVNLRKSMNGTGLRLSLQAESTRTVIQEQKQRGGIMGLFKR